jgi:predicted permease
VLFRPLPYAEPDRLVQVYGTTPPFGRGAVPSLAIYRAASTLIESMAGYVPGSRIVNDQAGAERIGIVRAERTLFRVLRVNAIAGRTFREDDPAGTVVLAASIARHRFGSEAAAVGRTLTLEGRPSEIAGVMPDDFRFPYDRSAAGGLARPPYEVWEVLDPPTNPRARFDRVVGRLKAGATRITAQDEMNATARRVAAEDPEMSAGRGIELVAFEDDVVGPVRRQLFILFAAVGLVLLAACANVANLLLVRGSARSREFAVRTAIGAGRGRLVRQVLTESTLLASAGGVLSLLVVMWGLPVLLSMPGLAVPRAAEIGVDWRVVTFLLLASMATGALFGLVPAVAASLTNAQEALKGGA